MVHIYKPRIGSFLTPLHDEILFYLENKPEFNNAYIFLEFRPNSKNARQIDILVLKHDAIFLLELKNCQFIYIKLNEDWIYHDEKTGNEVQYKKNVEGRRENPYSQAINTANAFRAYLRSHSGVFESDEFRTFLKNDNFQIFPIVFIPKSSFLRKIEKDPWCQLCIGAGGLEKCFTRSWKFYQKDAPDLNENDIEFLANKIGLEESTGNIQSAPGRENRALIKILNYLIEFQVVGTVSEDVRRSVFSSGEVRISQVRKALDRGLREGIFEKADANYKLSHVAKLYTQQGLTGQEIYDKWKNFRAFDDLRMNDSITFNIFSTLHGANRISPNVSSVSIPLINLKIPESLRIYNFAEIFKYKTTLPPLLFRSEGSLWADFNDNLILPLYDKENSDIGENLTTILSSSNKNIFIIGSPASGKTTLVKSIGRSFLDNSIPVIILTPNELDREAVTSLLQLSNQDTTDSSSTDIDLLVIIENVHLATTTEAHWLKSLLRITTNKKLRLLLTSRKHSLIVDGEDIFNKFSDPDYGYIINLDDEINKLLLIKNIIEVIIKKLTLDISSRIKNKIIQHISNNYADNIILLQLIIESLLTIIYSPLVTSSGIVLEPLQQTNANKFVKLLLNSNTGELIGKIHEKLLTSIDILVTDIVHNLDDLPLISIKKVLLLCYEFCFQELPIRDELIATLWKIDLNNVSKILNILEQQGLLNVGQNGYFMNHPEYAYQLLDAIESNSSDWHDLSQEFIKMYSEDLEITFTEIVQQQIRVLDPTIKLDWEPGESETGAEKKVELSQKEYFTLDQLAERVQELTIEDFDQFLWQNIKNSSLDILSFRNFWDKIGITELLALIDSAESLSGIAQLLLFIEESKWVKFSGLLERMNADHIIDLKEVSHSIYDRTFIQNLKKWQWSKLPYLELELFLRATLTTDRAKYSSFNELSTESFHLLDQQSPDHILSYMQTFTTYYNPYFFTDPLRRMASELGLKSVLYKQFVSLVLKNGPKNTNIMLVFDVINSLDPKSPEDMQLLLDGVKSWEADVLHQEIIQESGDGLISFLRAISTFQVPVFYQVFESILVEEVLEIIDQKDENGYYNSWVSILDSLGANKWSKLEELLDKLDLDIVMDLLLDYGSDAGKNHYIIRLLKVLLSHNWINKTKLLATIDFGSLLFQNENAFSQFHYTYELLALLQEYHVVIDEGVGKQIFLNLLQLGYEINLDEYIKIATKYQWSWQDWLDTQYFIDRLKTDYSDGLVLIKYFNDKGWMIPPILTDETEGVELGDVMGLQLRIDNLTRAVERTETKEEIELLNRMRKLSIARADLTSNETKDKALQLFQEAARSLSYASTLAEYQLFFDALQFLPEDIHVNVLDQINPEHFAIVASKEKYLAFSLIGQLKTYHYRYFTTFVKICLNNVSKESFNHLLNQFLPEILHAIPEIVTFLWTNNNYEKLCLLPNEFAQVIQGLKEQIISKIIDDPLVDPLMIELLDKLTFSTLEEKEGVYKTILLQIIKNAQLPKLLLLYQKGEPYTLLINTLLSQLEPNTFIELIQKNDSNSLVKLFGQITNIENGVFLQKFIETLPQDLWVEKINSSDPQDIPMLLLIITQYIPNIQTKIDRKKLDSHSLTQQLFSLD